MKTRNIKEYTDFYATFIRIQDSKPQQDYVVNPDGKEKGESDGNERKFYN